MGDSDEDDDDMWDDFEKDDVDTDYISANLLASVGMEANYVLHEGEPDEGLVTWVPPQFSGLDNSNAVDEEGVGWYREDVEAELWAELSEDDEDEEGTSQLSSNLQQAMGLTSNTGDNDGAAGDNTDLQRTRRGSVMSPDAVIEEGDEAGPQGPVPASPPAVTMRRQSSVEFFSSLSGIPTLSTNLLFTANSESNALPASEPSVPPSIEQPQLLSTAPNGSTASPAATDAETDDAENDPLVAEVFARHAGPSGHLEDAEAFRAALVSLAKQPTGRKMLEQMLRPASTATGVTGVLAQAGMPIQGFVAALEAR
mmetsp:Transcript_59087/g.162065  ORF Transcript_59087/g.162065 Transcript_59087/m.162065 type:complete len:312 (+) Transcript_59087:153-1088(+)